MKLNDATYKVHTKDHYKMIHTAESNCILEGSVYQIIYTEGEKFLWHVNCTYTIFSLRFFSVFCPPKIKLWWEIMHKRVKHKHHIHPSILEGRKKGQHRWSRNNNDMIWSASMCLQNCTIKYKGMKIIIFFLFWMKRRNCKRPTNGLKATQFFFISLIPAFVFIHAHYFVWFYFLCTFKLNSFCD